MANSKTEKKTTKKNTKSDETVQPVEQQANAQESNEPVQQQSPATEAPSAPKGKGAKMSSKSKAASKAADSKASPTIKAPKNLKVAKKGTKDKSQKGGEGEGEGDVDDDDEVQEAGKRYFKCIRINAEGVAESTGRYSGKKPKQAASKACTRLYEDEKKATGNVPDQIIYGMHECTRTSKKKKKYFYVGKRNELAEPEEVTIDKIDPNTGANMVIRYYYNNDIRKLTDVNCAEYQKLFNYDAKKNERGNNEEHDEAQPEGQAKGGSKKGKPRGKAATTKASTKAGKASKSAKKSAPKKSAKKSPAANPKKSATAQASGSAGRKSKAAEKTEEKPEHKKTVVKKDSDVKVKKNSQTAKVPKQGTKQSSTKTKATKN